MPLATQIPATADFNTLLVGIESIVQQAACNNPDAWKHFSQHDAERLEAQARSVRHILTTKPPSHVCGLAGYDGMRDPPCPACEAMYAKGLSSRSDHRMHV